jgi:lipopolysaccharide/colanic/teichoic acid biosynthesis glycosyltransferase
MAEAALPEVVRAGVQPHARLSSYDILKRGLDVTLASLTLVLLSPLLLIIAIAVKVSSPGPVIFAQERLRGRRVRRGGSAAWIVEPFTLYKFRTMEDGADIEPHREYMEAYLTGDAERLKILRPDRKPGESYRPANDRRVTRLGAILRRYSLDEIPQLWNVLKGDMSLVGPRPPVPYEIDKYQPRHLKRLVCRPGITGWAQVRGRAGIGFEETVELDGEYLARRSILFDLWILLMTLPTVLLSKGAD